MSADLLCRCGHLQSVHGVDDDDPRERNTICGAGGCPCEAFRSFEALAQEATEPLVAHVAELQAKPDLAVIEILETMLANARSGSWGRADVLWAFEQMKHRLLHGGEPK